MPIPGVPTEPDIMQHVQTKTFARTSTAYSTGPRRPDRFPESPEHHSIGTLAGLLAAETNVHRLSGVLATIERIGRVKHITMNDTVG